MIKMTLPHWGAMGAVQLTHLTFLLRRFMPDCIAYRLAVFLQARKLIKWIEPKG